MIGLIVNAHYCAKSDSIEYRAYVWLLPFMIHACLFTWMQEELVGQWGWGGLAWPARFGQRAGTSNGLLADVSSNNESRNLCFLSSLVHQWGQQIRIYSLWTAADADAFGTYGSGSHERSSSNGWTCNTQTHECQRSLGEWQRDSKFRAPWCLVCTGWCSSGEGKWWENI